MTENIFEDIADLITESLTPIKKHVVRKGKTKIDFECGPGFKYDPATHSCVMMGQIELKRRKKAAKKARKTDKLHSMNSVYGAHEALSRTKSEKVRKSMGW